MQQIGEIAIAFCDEHLSTYRFAQKKIHVKETGEIRTRLQTDLLQFLTDIWYLASYQHMKKN